MRKDWRFPVYSVLSAHVVAEAGEASVHAISLEWKDASKRALCYMAKGGWNWREYHAVRAAAFTLLDAQPGAHSVIDLRGSTRKDLPAGAAAHAQSFGRITQAHLSGRNWA